MGHGCGPSRAAHGGGAGENMDRGSTLSHIQQRIEKIKPSFFENVTRYSVPCLREQQKYF